MVAVKDSSDESEARKFCSATFSLFLVPFPSREADYFLQKYLKVMSSQNTSIAINYCLLKVHFPCVYNINFLFYFNRKAYTFLKDKIFLNKQKPQQLKLSEKKQLENSYKPQTEQKSWQNFQLLFLKSGISSSQELCQCCFATHLMAQCTKWQHRWQSQRRAFHQSQHIKRSECWPETQIKQGAYVHAPFLLL